MAKMDYTNIRQRIMTEVHSFAAEKSEAAEKNPMLKCLKAILAFFLGTRGKSYAKPVISGTEALFLLTHVHFNIRFLCHFIDLTLESGTALVCCTFIALNIMVCPCLGYIYAFLGRYGARSFITLWDIFPLLQGISVSVFIFECMKMVETSLMISSGFMMLGQGLYTDYHMFPQDEQINRSQCDFVQNGRFKVRPGYGVNYGISRTFNEIGYNFDAPMFSFWSMGRTHFLIGIWVVVMILRLMRNKHVRYLLEHAVPFISLIVVLILVVCGRIGSAKMILPVGKVNNIQQYIQVISFAVAEYLPTHWITIGYINPNPLTKTQVWGTSLIMVFAGCGLSIALPFYLEDFQQAIGGDLECMHFFGMHFIFVIVPYYIRYHLGKYISVIAIPCYVLVMCFNGMGYINSNLQLLGCALAHWRHWMYRYRNLVIIVMTTTLNTVTAFLCTSTMHYDIHFYTTGMYVNISMVCFILTVLGIGLYGLKRIDSDYHFLVGSEYPNIISLKILFVATSVICVFSTLFWVYEAKLMKNIILEWVILCPVVFGSVLTILRRKRYHGIIWHPLPSWGRPDAAQRVIRRRRNLRQMFIYRTNRECKHNCLLKSKVLAFEIEAELQLRKILLEEIADEELELLGKTGVNFEPGVSEEEETSLL